MRFSGNAQRPGFRTEGLLLYYITDRKQLQAHSLLFHIRLAVSRGVDFIQIREKDLADRELFELARRAVSIAEGTRCRILVNGRADIALASGAHGVHLPSVGLRVSDLRPWLPRGFLVGISAHSLRDTARASAARADYVLLGPVFPTESKSGYGPPLGLGYLRRVCVKVPLPVFGLGGISRDRIDAVVEAGAAGVAGITLFQGNPDQVPTGPA